MTTWEACIADTKRLAEAEREHAKRARSLATSTDVPEAEVWAALAKAREGKAKMLDMLAETEEKNFETFRRRKLA